VDLHQKFAEYAHTAGKHFFVMYGQTEASPRMAYLPYEKALEKCGSIGIAIPGGKFSLLGTDGKEINEPYVHGELVYSGANVSLGYAEAGDDLNKGDEFKGILYTGDLAQFDKDGYFYMVGRKKRFLKIFGNRLNLEETERLIQSHFNTECACTGVDDKMHVFVTGNFSTEEIKKFISEKTALNPVAFDIYPVDAIPKNEYGKVLYQSLEKNGSK
jgi:acyl-CoA synthetase (AMP-forming)/AMP-acid ligase II